MTLPIATVVSSRGVAVCPFCSEETDYTVHPEGGFVLGVHRVPDWTSTCPDSRLRFAALDLEDPEVDRP